MLSEDFISACEMVWGNNGKVCEAWLLIGGCGLTALHMTAKEWM